MTNSKHIAQLIGFADFPIRIRSVPHLHYFRIDHPPATALVQRLLPKCPNLRCRRWLSTSFI